MAAMASKFNFECVIQYYTDQWLTPSEIMTSRETQELFAYPIKLNISTKKTVTKILPKKLYCDFELSLPCNQENNGQNFMP